MINGMIKRLGQPDELLPAEHKIWNLVLCPQKALTGHEPAGDGADLRVVRLRQIWPTTAGAVGTP